MARYAFVANNIVTNIVEFALTPPLVADSGEWIVPIGSTVSVGDVFDSSSWQNTQDRTSADAIVDVTSSNGKLIRALAAVMVDEINSLRTLALINLSPRTLAQTRVNMKSKIDSGVVDS